MPDTKVTADTLFYAGSTTKAQTAACLSALIQNGSHEALAGQWSTTLASILKDDFVLRDQWATDHMTLEDAVSHRTGLPRHDRSLARERDGAPLSLRDNVRNLRNLPYVNEPRTKFVYSNYMYMALSHVIETVTKKELKQVMRELIWDPLGMQSTYFGLEDASKAPEPLATGYIWINETQQHAKTAYMPVTDLSGAAAVISNVRDYARWIQGLLNETQLFSESVHQDILTSRMIGYGLPNGNLDVNLYGLGWFRTTFRGKVVYRHDGSMIGFKAQVYWFPDDKFGFVIFSNSDDSRTAINDISWKLIADKFGIPETELLNTTKRFVPPPPRQPWQRRQANTQAIQSLGHTDTPGSVRRSRRQPLPGSPQRSRAALLQHERHGGRVRRRRLRDHDAPCRCLQGEDPHRGAPGHDVALWAEFPTHIWRQLGCGRVLAGGYGSPWTVPPRRICTGRRREAFGVEDEMVGLGAV